MIPLGGGESFAVPEGRLVELANVVLRGKRGGL